MIRRRVIVTGRVQGVFYRDTCRRMAGEYGVNGWVRNNADGAVEAVFEGERDAVDAMCQWCASGPAYADVQHVEIAEEPVEHETRFEIR
ncbi:acylphosphatase [Antricoccus suffuscus]|uniref:acylphosphatase n=1 Tax=Antricoccus suffuscus TaxID=1629062 RepID=A0A2T1A5M2_9ACTN|nr:acylphosphatase [Antricoccus suffuscus]PRZ43889.1 acylphosphatase [Antricoccus suffuscus]